MSLRAVNAFVNNFVANIRSLSYCQTRLADSLIHSHSSHTSYWLCISQANGPPIVRETYTVFEEKERDRVRNSERQARWERIQNKKKSYPSTILLLIIGRSVIVQSFLFFCNIFNHEIVLLKSVSKLYAHHSLRSLPFANCSVRQIEVKENLEVNK